MSPVLEHYLVVSIRRGEQLLELIMDHGLIVYYFISSNRLLKLEHVWALDVSNKEAQNRTAIFGEPLTWQKARLR